MNEPNRPSLSWRMLIFAIKFVIFFTIFYLLWQPFIATYGNLLARAGNVVWPIITRDEASLGLSEDNRFLGHKRVYEGKEARVKLARAWEFVFTMVGFLALISASSNLWFGDRLKALVLGLGGMFAAHLFHILIFAESSLAGWYVQSLLPSETYAAFTAQGIYPAFSYTPTQYRVLFGLTNFWDTMGQHLWPVILWFTLNFWYKRGKGPGWADKIF